MARGWRQVELVKRRPSPECERLRENWIGVQRDQGAADNQVLLDLEILAPRRLLAPLGDEVSRDHASVSMLAFTSSRQSFDRRAPSASTPGRSLVKLRACALTCSLSSVALSPAPICSRR